MKTVYIGESQPVARVPLGVSKQFTGGMQVVQNGYAK